MFLKILIASALLLSAQPALASDPLVRIVSKPNGETCMMINGSMTPLRGWSLRARAVPVRYRADARINGYDACPSGIYVVPTSYVVGR